MSCSRRLVANMHDLTGVEGPARCSLWAEGPQWVPECTVWSARLSLDVAPPGTAGFDFCLVLGVRSALYCNSAPGRRALETVFDLDSDAVPARFRNPGAANEALLRAVGVRRGRRPDVIDMTAGLGVDALLMASAGCSVRLIEQAPALVIMLLRGLRRWQNTPALRSVASRLQLEQGDARSLLPGMSPADVVYLDPMYRLPGRRAAPAGAMQLLHALHGDAAASGSAAELLTLALAHAREQVVVKRPRKAPPVLDKPLPHHHIVASSTRFDVYHAATLRAASARSGPIS